MNSAPEKVVRRENGSWGVGGREEDPRRAAQEPEAHWGWKGTCPAEGIGSVQTATTDPETEAEGRRDKETERETEEEKERTKGYQ